METDDQRRNHRAEAVERLHEQLQESLRALVTSQDWQQALAVAARFHDYSFANTQLIWLQAAARGFRPSRVAGYRTWQDLGRQVRRGERGIPILAPVTRKVEAADKAEEEQERRVVGFRAVHVFDISQTDGDPLPEVRTALLKGDLPAHWGKVTELITSAGFTLEVADTDRLGEANGITDWRDRQVVVRATLPGAQRFKTAVHELAHIQLHEPTSGDRPNCRGIVEVEAESVAYMVCAALGVDSAGYSLPYVASWSGGDLEKVAGTAERVIRCARQVLTRLEPEPILARDLGSPQILTTEKRGVPERPVQELTEVLRTEERHPELEEALLSAVVVYQARLESRDGNEARRFLQERGIAESTADRWQLGYAPAAWDTLVNHLRDQGTSDEVLLEAGLAGRARTGRLYDRMRGRLVFPIFDGEGTPRGFAGRLLTGEGPKYLNSPETPLYKKSSLLYGLHLAEPTIVDTQQAVIVEGYTDAIAAHQAGITNAVATGGTALTRQHLDALRPAASTLILSFDGDAAGIQAAQRVAELPKPTLSGLRLKVACLPDGSDPASLLSEGEARILQGAIAKPIPLVHYLVDNTIKHYNLDEPEALVRALRAAGPLVDQLTDSSSRNVAVAHLAERVGRSEEMIATALKSYSRTSQRQRERSVSRSLR